MPTLIDTLESDFRWLGALAGLGTLVYAIYNMLRAQQRPTGRQTGAARQVLRSRYLVIATLIFFILGWVLWKPLPVQLHWLLRILAMLVGGVVFIGSLGLYVWGLRTLGENFNASSGFGVRLHQAHRLITRGPYAYVRHPMYTGVILTGWGGLLLYRTWTMLLFAVIMLGLVYRARKEEQALAETFGVEWKVYTHHVPGWIPHFEQWLRKGKL